MSLQPASTAERQGQQPRPACRVAVVDDQSTCVANCWSSEGQSFADFEVLWLCVAEGKDLATPRNWKKNLDEHYRKEGKRVQASFFDLTGQSSAVVADWVATELRAFGPDIVIWDEHLGPLSGGRIRNRVFETWRPQSVEWCVLTGFPGDLIDTELPSATTPETEVGPGLWAAFEERVYFVKCKCTKVTAAVRESCEALKFVAKVCARRRELGKSTLDDWIDTALLVEPENEPSVVDDLQRTLKASRAGRLGRTIRIERIAIGAAAGSNSASALQSELIARLAERLDRLCGRCVLVVDRRLFPSSQVTANVIVALHGLVSTRYYRQLRYLLLTDQARVRADAVADMAAAPPEFRGVFSPMLDACPTHLSRDGISAVAERLESLADELYEYLSPNPVPGEPMPAWVDEFRGGVYVSYGQEPRAQWERLCDACSGERLESVLLIGPSGAGKTQLAYALTRYASTNRGRLPHIVEVNCSQFDSATMPSWVKEFKGNCRMRGVDYQQCAFGRVELATGGTLFFDEIGHSYELFHRAILAIADPDSAHSIGEGNNDYFVELERGLRDSGLVECFAKAGREKGCTSHRVAKWARENGSAVHWYSHTRDAALPAEGRGHPISHQGVETNHWIIAASLTDKVLEDKEVARRFQGATVKLQNVLGSQPLATATLAYHIERRLRTEAEKTGVVTVFRGIAANARERLAEAEYSLSDLELLAKTVLGNSSSGLRRGCLMALPELPRVGQAKSAFASGSEQTPPVAGDRRQPIVNDSPNQPSEPRVDSDRNEKKWEKWTDAVFELVADEFEAANTKPSRSEIVKFLADKGVDRNEGAIKSMLYRIRRMNGGSDAQERIRNVLLKWEDQSAGSKRGSGEGT